METRTTAQLRDLARQAEEQGQYLTASELYQLAINRYPVHTPDNQLARADIEALRIGARRSLQAHKERHNVPGRADPLVTTIRGALDEQRRQDFRATYDKLVANTSGPGIAVKELDLPERAL